MARVRDDCGRECDAAGLAVFRFVFGLILIIEVWRYFYHGWIDRYWIEPTYHLAYFGFGWITPWPGDGMHLHFMVLGVAAAAMAVGYRYRLAAWVVFACFTFQFVLEQSRYLNHFYAAILFCFLLAVTPAHATWSFDSMKGRVARPGVAPCWAIGLFRFQVAVIYAFAGVAKWNADWLGGEPWQGWLRARANMPAVQGYLSIDPNGLLFGLGSALFDLVVVLGLLWAPTRLMAFCAAVVFHFLNAQLFDIGIFPWMMIAGTTVFFAPAWPRLLLLRPRSTRDTPDGTKELSRRVGWATLTGLVLYAFLQLFLPLRHWLYPGDVAWSDEGHRFSWRMMLRSKDGEVTYRVEAGDSISHVRLDQFLEPWQARVAATRPDMIQQAALFLAAEARARTHHQVRVFALTRVSLNGRKGVPIVDPRVDLAATSRSLAHAGWITTSPK